MDEGCNNDVGNNFAEMMTCRTVCGEQVTSHNVVGKMGYITPWLQNKGLHYIVLTIAHMVLVLNAYVAIIMSIKENPCNIGIYDYVKTALGKCYTLY